MPSSSPGRRKHPPTVAVVEADAPLLEAMRFALEVEGYRVRAFMAGEALLAARELGEVGCFVIDHKPPVSDSPQIIRELRRQGFVAPALVVTARPYARLREVCRRLDAAIIEKPLLGENLNTSIRDLLAPAASAEG